MVEIRWFRGFLDRFIANRRRLRTEKDCCKFIALIGKFYGSNVAYL